MTSLNTREHRRPPAISAWDSRVWCNASLVYPEGAENPEMIPHTVFWAVVLRGSLARGWDYYGIDDGIRARG